MPERDLPLIVEAGPDSTAAALKHRLQSEPDWLDGMLKDAGAVLFRGYTLPDAAAFEAISPMAVGELTSYDGSMSQRSRVKGNVYNSTYAHRRTPIPLHTELCYLPRIPRRFAFFCARQPGSGGQTPLVDMAAVHDALPAEIRSAFNDRGVCQVQYLNEHMTRAGAKTWVETFETTDRDEALEQAQARGFGASWMGDDRLRLERRYPGLMRHPDHGRWVWFNQAQLIHLSMSWEYWRSGMYAAAALLRFREWKAGDAGKPGPGFFYGDGGPIPRTDVIELRRRLWEHGTMFDWRAGDLLVIDNLWIGHGRMPFRGDREILVAMGSAVEKRSLEHSAAPEGY